MSWFSSYPQNLIRMDYEAVVENLEHEARQLLDFIGLDFEPGVLRFFENERVVLTPSTEQVRQPIYKSSVDQGLRYGNALDPLIRSLGELAPRPFRQAPT